MSPQIDFYILPDQELESGYRLLSRLLAKTQQADNHVLIWVNDETEAASLSERLWNAGPETFLAHSIESDDPLDQIVIAWQDRPDSQTDILINMADKVPAFYSHFNRIIELTVQHPDVLKANREHFQHFRNEGLAPKVHKIASQMK